MKNTLILLLSILAISCNSQIVSLETAAQCIANPNCQDYNCEKDINNSLDKYIGTWKGVHEGKTYELKFNKSLYENFLGHKRDRITGRLRVTIGGQLPLTIFDNFNEADDSKTNFGGLGFQKDLNYYMLTFSGPSTDICLNSGTVFINVKPNQPHQMEVIYLLDTDFYTKECPSSFETTIPEKQNIFLTKQ